MRQTGSESSLIFVGVKNPDYYETKQNTIQTLLPMDTDVAFMIQIVAIIIALVIVMVSIVF